MHNTLLHVRIVAYVSVNVLSTLQFLIKAFYYVRSAGLKSGQQFSAFFFMTRWQAWLCKQRMPSNVEHAGAQAKTPL